MATLKSPRRTAGPSFRSSFTKRALCLSSSTPSTNSSSLQSRASCSRTRILFILDQPAQHTTVDDNISKRYEINFGKIYLSRPTMTEADGSTHPMFPQEARLRNLTYSSPLYVDMGKRVMLYQGLRIYEPRRRGVETCLPASLTIEFRKCILVKSPSCSGRNFACSAA